MTCRTASSAASSQPGAETDCSDAEDNDLDGYTDCDDDDCVHDPFCAVTSASASSRSRGVNSSDGGPSSESASSSEGGTSSIGIQHQSSSLAGDASSAPMETGNCCIEDEIFGFCFAQIARSVCENTDIGGIYLGQYPCIQAPRSGYNCGSAETVGSSSANHSSSGGSSSSNICGDGVLQPALGEECDEGPRNSVAPNAICRPDCKTSRCGDGIVDNEPVIRSRETCDDGALNSEVETALCRTDCKSRNVFYIIGEWVGDLKLYSVNGTPLPNAPKTTIGSSLITIGVLVLFLF